MATQPIVRPASLNLGTGTTPAAQVPGEAIDARLSALHRMIENRRPELGDKRTRDLQDCVNAALDAQYGRGYIDGAKDAR